MGEGPMLRLLKYFRPKKLAIISQNTAFNDEY
jgi:hypothetical protein